MKKIVTGLVAVIAAVVGASAAVAGGHAPAKSASLSIVHVQKGCHVWVEDGKQSADLRIPLARGGRLSVLNQDIDGHKLVEVAGPVKLKLPTSMQMNGRMILTFPMAGVYQLDTSTFQLKGMPDVRTTGADNVLRLTVVVG